MKKLNNFYFTLSKIPNQNLIYEELEKLTTQINPEKFEWDLVGGLSTALSFGNIYREHQDFDIEIDITNLESITKQFGINGYKLCIGVPSRGRRFLPIKIFKEVNFKKCSIKTHSLYFVNSQENGFLNYIDLMLKFESVGITTRYLVNDEIKTQQKPSKYFCLGSKKIKLRDPTIHRILLDRARTKLSKNIPDKKKLEDIL